MLTDWLIFLDFLEENNCNTTFLRLITPIIFGIFECHRYNYSFGSSYGYGYGNSDAYGYGYGNAYGAGYGSGYGFSYLNSYDEEH